LDWSRYLGRVKWRDYDPQQYYNFRAYLDFGGGQVTDLFTHWIDVVHMLMGKDTPRSAIAAGGVYHYRDGRTAPDAINVFLEYPSELTVTFEATLSPDFTGAAVEICGTEGSLRIGRNRYHHHYPLGGNLKHTIVMAEPGSSGTDPLTLDHVKNFLECMRSRKLPNGDVLIGHRSAQASHLANLAYKQKRRLALDTALEQIQPGELEDYEISA
jgi:predicted dehydrogenase